MTSPRALRIPFALLAMAVAAETAHAQGHDHEPPAMECPTELAASAQGDGSVLLTFHPPAEADGLNLYRADGDGPMTYIATLPPDAHAYTDTGVPAGASSTYLLATTLHGFEQQGCPQVEVAAVPDIPLPLLAVAALAGALAYAIRR